MRKADKRFRNGKEDSVSFVVDMLEGFIGELAHGRAVAYVGAGVSQSANLKSWDQILKGLKEAAKRRLEHDDPVTRSYFDDRLTKLERNLEIGDWLQSVLQEGEFEATVKGLISLDNNKRAPAPSPVHHYLARLRFSMVLTTNYDDLLEMAHRDAKIDFEPTLTWKDPQDILSAIKRSEFRIVHVHGVPDRGKSLVLAGSQYAAVQYSADETDPRYSQLRFGEVFKWLLKTRTFLFLGNSLQDPDLIFYLQQVTAELGKSAITHYALLPYDEAPQRRREILKRSLNVQVIPVGNRSVAGRSPDWRTKELTYILRDLSAQVALQSFELGLPRFPTSDDVGFCLDSALQILLEDAVRLTGSFRGDFCLPMKPGSHGSEVLHYALHTAETKETIKKHPAVPPNSVCGIAYYQATPEYGVYVANVDRSGILSPSSRLGHYGEVNYEAGHTSVKSELAMPIETDSGRVGVLNLESNLIDAYSLEHIQAARKIAQKAGRLYAAAHERQRQARRLAPDRTEPAYEQMHKLCERLWCMARNCSGAAVEISLLIYHADYRSGVLKSQDPNRTVLLGSGMQSMQPPHFSFTHESAKKRSLAVRVYVDRRPYAYPDTGAAIRQGKLPADSYPKQLGIKGPLIGFQVSTHGHVAGVVACWLRKAPAAELDGRDIELFRRAAHVMANCFQFEREKGATAAQNHFPSIEMVDGVLNSLDAPLAPGAADNGDLLDAFGRYYRAEIGGAVAAFLQLLREREEEFATKMATYRNSDRPTLWVSPRRCRCWVRTTAADGEPRFVLALQVAIDGTSEFKNQVVHHSQHVGVAMQPFRRALESELEMDRSAHSKEAGPPQDILKESVEIRVSGKTYNMPSLVFDGNPYMSFLLSRVSAYPFAFLQKPGLFIRDIMSDVLDKDPALPWFVCPLIVNQASDWSESFSPDSTTLSDLRLAGYLTFDRGSHQADKSKATEARPRGKEFIEVQDEWAAFQNDLIHQMDLFAACLAQRDCFRSLLPGSATGTAGSSRASAHAVDDESS